MRGLWWCHQHGAGDYLPCPLHPMRNQQAGHAVRHEQRYRTGMGHSVLRRCNPLVKARVFPGALFDTERLGVQTLPLRLPVTWARAAVAGKNEYQMVCHGLYGELGKASPVIAGMVEPCSVVKRFLLPTRPVSLS